MVWTQALPWVCSVSSEEAGLARLVLGAHGSGRSLARGPLGGRMRAEAGKRETG